MMFEFGMKLLLFCFCLSLQMMHCYSQVCIPTWTPYLRSSSIEGSSEQSAVQLQDCLARCERRNSCLAVDFHTSSSIPCWLHISQNYLIDGYFYANKSDDVTQYRISRNCTDYGKGPECPVQWVQNASVGSYYGEQVNYWTEYDCFTYCLYSNACVAVDFNNKTSPPCWIHKDSDPNNTPTESEGVVQYRLNKTCPIRTNNSILHIGRCVSQYFPMTDWCPAGFNIHINDSRFKVNPLCCYRNAEDSFPPDTSPTGNSLFFLDVQVLYADRAYFDEINSSCDGLPSCSSSIRAKSNNVGGLITKPICSDGDTGTNYVSILYQCISSELTTRTTRKGTPVATTLPTLIGTPVTTLIGTPVTTLIGTPVTTLIGTPVAAPVPTPVPTLIHVGTPVTTIIGTPVATPVATITAENKTMSTSNVRTTTLLEDIAKAASKDATTKENSNRLIIGLVVGLGVPLILIIIIVVVVVLVRRRKRREKLSELPRESNYQVDNFYMSETVPRGAIPEYEQNEISMSF